MTSTTTETRAAHQQPCFCDICWVTSLQDLLNERAKLLHAALCGHGYRDGFESELADELIAAIPASRRGDALEHMLEWDHLHPHIMAVECLLNETDDHSYAVQKEMAGILLAAIHAQDAAPNALRLLIINEICDRCELRTLL